MNNLSQIVSRTDIVMSESNLLGKQGAQRHTVRIALLEITLRIQRKRYFLCIFTEAFVVVVYAHSTQFL
jgi:hypothetical protein